MVCQDEVDEVAGVLEEDLDRFPGEEDRRPEDHRGGAAGAGSPELTPTIFLCSGRLSLLVPPQA